jgi:hypothetical protein
VIDARLIKALLSNGKNFFTLSGVGEGIRPIVIILDMDSQHGFLA